MAAAEKYKSAQKSLTPKEREDKENFEATPASEPQWARRAIPLDQLRARTGRPSRPDNKEEHKPSFTNWFNPQKADDVIYNDLSDVSLDDFMQPEMAFDEYSKLRESEITENSIKRGI